MSDSGMKQVTCQTQCCWKYKPRKITLPTLVGIELLSFLRKSNYHHSAPVTRLAARELSLLSQFSRKPRSWLDRQMAQRDCIR